MHARSAKALGLIALTALALSSGPAYAARRDLPASEAHTFDGKLRKLALGISILDGRQLDKLDAFRAAIGGQRVATWTIWRNWGHPDFSPFPMDAAKGARARGAVPIIWWDPITPSDWADTTYTRHQNIINGDHDAYIRDFAREAKRYGHTILLRFASQANSDYLPWAWDYSATDDNTIDTYIAAWRHVHGIFREVGARNVKFVWSVATQTCAGDCLKRDLGYPGDKYVDYMGFTWENWGSASPCSRFCSEAWVPMLDGFKPVADKLSTISDKPIMATAIASGPDPGSKAEWIREGYPAVHDNLPRIVAIMYLNVDLSPQDRDWSLSDGPLKAYAEIAAMPAFQGRIPGG